VGSKGGTTWGWLAGALVDRGVASRVGVLASVGLGALGGSEARRGAVLGRAIGWQLVSSNNNKEHRMSCRHLSFWFATYAAKV